MSESPSLFPVPVSFPVRRPRVAKVVVCGEKVFKGPVKIHYLVSRGLISLAEMPRNLIVSVANQHTIGFELGNHPAYLSDASAQVGVLL